MKARIFFWSLTSALAGFLFGFDTVVISGAEQTIQELWGLSPGMHGFAMAAALCGTVLGSLLGGWPADRLGRRATLLWIGILYFVSAVWSALSSDVYSFIVARFIGGLGVGISTVAAPMYISEIAPAEYRGRLAGMFQFNIVFGILIAFLSNALIARVGDNAWRWMLGVEAFPALLYTVLCFGIPESPRWLIGRNGNREAAIKILHEIRPASSPAELEAKADEIAEASSERHMSARFWTKRLSVPILLAFLIAFFNQLSGINNILYFAPRLLGLAGIDDPLKSAVSLGATNLVFTLIGLWLIDRLGRKTLLTIGSLGYIASLAVCAWAFLSFAEFKVVSKAIDLSGAAAKVQALDDGTRTLKPEDEGAARDAYADALVVLQEVSALGDYRGTEHSLAADTLPAAAIEAAEAAKEEASELLGGLSLVVLVSLLVFIAAHAVGQGAVIWVFISEIFPNRHRAEGQALGSFTHWLFAATLTLVFPIAISAFDPGFLFVFFCGMMVLQLLWVIFMVPETKGISLEEMQHKLGIDVEEAP